MMIAMMELYSFSMEHMCDTVLTDTPSPFSSLQASNTIDFNEVY